jgi:sporulation protein YlmC with PRC-barrel domain
MSGNMASLHKLSDSGLTVASSAEDVRGRKVLDRHGEEVGTVDDLMIDDKERKVRFLLVASGGFLGLGETKFLIPVDAITRITSDEVHIDKTREHVARGPAYDPDLSEHDEYWGRVYGHYGYMPYWGAGYIVTPYPYYPPL